MESPPVAVRARTQATAVDALQADAAARALAMCVQQPAFRQPDDDALFILLGVSTWLRALVAAHWCGRLVMRTHVYAPDKATALAAWLSRHGALLAELQLDMDTHGADWRTAAADAASRKELHPAARVPAQLPGNLTRLLLNHCPEGNRAAQHAATQAATATFAAVCSRQLLQLRILELPYSWADQLATVLPALAALSQLTSLVMPLPDGGSSWLSMQHLPAQLQQLELADYSDYDAFYTAAYPELALEHVTGLTSLCMPSTVFHCITLPHGLRALRVTDDTDDMAPILQLEQLAVLDVAYCSAPAEQLHQLSRLTGLEQLSMGAYESDEPLELDEMAAALSVLPLKRLDTCNQALTAACLDHLGACTRLTDLQLRRTTLAPGATPEQLAAMLGRLTALERYSNPYMRQPSASDAYWAPVCQVLARLPRLTACSLSGAQLGPAAVAHLAAATQLTELCVESCGVDDASVLALCSGLTGLRRLDVSHNDSVTDGCLEGIAGLRQLTWLDVFVTRIVTKSGLQQLQAARPGLRVQSWSQWL